MHILVIDNESQRINELKTLISNNTFKVVSYNKIPTIPISEYDLIILSGGSNHPVVGNDHLYKDEITLIRECTKPMLGICLGFELIAHSFGAKLELLDNKTKGLIEISPVGKNILFKNLPNFLVYESHRWAIKELPKDFIALAKSKDGIEAFQHKNKNIFGFQFHPSVFPEKTTGDEIFNNLLKNIST